MFKIERKKPRPIRIKELQDKKLLKSHKIIFSPNSITRAR